VQEVGPRSPAYKTEIRELLETYETEGAFVVKEDGVLVFQEELENLSDDTYALVKDLVGLIVIEGLTDDTYDLLIGTGDYYQLDEMIIEDEDEEDEEDEEEDEDEEDEED
jgi:hypothetical protein